MPVFAETLHPSPRTVAVSVARHLRLALRRRDWKGAVGNWSGTGIGSSIDFQDHRPYLPGDDPRYIDWAAYARSGQYIMKLYREEVSPRVDLLMDVSRSMRFDPEKWRRSQELFHFCFESAIALGASPVCHEYMGKAWRPVSTASILSGRWPAEAPLGMESETSPPVSEPIDLKTVALRAGSLRVLISDLLFDAAPESLLRPFSASRGSGAILAPFAAGEAEPSWESDVEFVDCETMRFRRQRVDGSLLNRYRIAYDRHFSSWRDQSRRYQVRFARVASGNELADALYAEALRNGVVETWG
jgi:hypothetical protein